MANGKTTTAIRLSDKNLLKLRVLQLVEQGNGEQMSFSEYLDRYISNTIEGYIINLNNEHYEHMLDTRHQLLQELFDCRTEDDNIEDFYQNLPEEEFAKRVDDHYRATT